MHRYGLDRLMLAAVGSPEWLVTAGTYLLAGAAVTSGLLLHKLSGISDQILWTERFRIPLAAAVGMTLGAFGLLTSGFQKSASNRKAKFWFPIVTNVVVLFVCLFIAEASLRAIAKPGPFGVYVGGTALVPYNWQAVAGMDLKLIEQSHSATSFYVEDALLGWTIGPGREGNGGMYKSSAEGLRSLDRASKLSTRDAPHRVALFGDSFTFSDDVPFDQSWGHFLEMNLGPATQVLNFGVDGYGVDQAYLRFKRDATVWKPEVSVLGFIQDDLYRDVTVYPFFRAGWERPFSKPRFSVDDAGLELLNVPNIPSAIIFGKKSVWDLPLLDYDGNFDSYCWEQHPLYVSYVVRFMATRVRRWTPRTVYTTDEAAVQLGSRLIKKFTEAAQTQDTKGLIVYLPTRNDFDGSGPVLARRVQAILATEGIDAHDMTSCLTHRVPPARLFIEGKPHYSGEANAAVAACVQPLVTALLH